MTRPTQPHEAEDPFLEIAPSHGGVESHKYQFKLISSVVPLIFKGLYPR